MGFYLLLDSTFSQIVVHTIEARPAYCIIFIMSTRAKVAGPATTHELSSRLQPAFDEQSQNIQCAVHNATAALLDLQNSEGWWCGPLTGDSTLESDYILLQIWMHRVTSDGAWNPPNRERIEKACRRLLERQLPDGGWSIYRPGPSEVNATVRAYTALKLSGFDSNSAEMRRARERALYLGGLHACNSYTKINFSFFNLYPTNLVPCVPPEIVLAPADILYRMSSWTRSIIVPLSIVQARGKKRLTPSDIRVDELISPKRRSPRTDANITAVIFKQVDKVAKVWSKYGVKALRACAIREAERWMLEHTRYTDGLGAIYPSMMYFIMALDSLGYPPDHPDLLTGIRHFEDLIMEDKNSLQFQPAVSPVWDTAISMYALSEAGLQSSNPALAKAADWLLSKEIRRKGDWSIKRPDLMPSGWAFEFANEFYPDIDDTAMVLLALSHSAATVPDRQKDAGKRAVEWLLGMQSSDGGWAAFDVDNNWQLLNKVPFADHNAMLDPSCPDITGRVLDALMTFGARRADPAIRRGVEYLTASQEANGSWYGRWGVNYIYGTFLAICGLAKAAPDELSIIQKAAAWLRSVQNEDGGWGESCASYDRGGFVPMSSTPSQTAWAILGLLGARDQTSTSLHRGVKFLLETQGSDGRWKEELTTGTGFPCVFYISFGLYKQYFPLLALARVMMLRQGKSCSGTAVSGLA